MALIGPRTRGVLIGPAVASLVITVAMIIWGINHCLDGNYFRPGFRVSRYLGMFVSKHRDPMFIFNHFEAQAPRTKLLFSEIKTLAQRGAIWVGRLTVD